MGLKLCSNLPYRERWRNQARRISLQMGTLKKHCLVFQASLAWFILHQCTNLLDKRISASLSALVKEIWNLVVLPHVSTENGQAPDKVFGTLTSAEVPSTVHQRALRTRCHLPYHPAMMVEMTPMGPQDKDVLPSRHRTSPDHIYADRERWGRIDPFLR